MKAKFMLMIGILSLTACVNSNDKVFQNKNYQLVAAELSTDSALYQYVPYDRSSHMIIIDRLNIPESYASQFIKDWYAKETQYRKKDCQLQYKTYQNIPYATCDFNNGSRYAIYVLGTKENKGFAKVYISAKKQSEMNEKNLVKALTEFYP
ncbi:hypothetical protein [Pasteurella canis]|uniref:Lipoprotein n=1 Tax=Pasteurella canis TaxID=753 RepID=A0ABQ4VGC6_9PAST|nr:hypothetical protein [Pasteurella canis]UEC22919.1 hypothetical protein K7G93_001675 [Pasteurella canis]GJH42439.1 hypothetical protein PA42_06130 [Pasteurella canis]